MSAKHIIISGSVQGVFFRASAQKVACDLGVCGWIQNNEDGTVEVHVEGEHDAVTMFVDYCGKGPEGAVVESINIQDAPPENAQEFAIIH